MTISETIANRKPHLWKTMDGLEFWAVPNAESVSYSIHHHYRGRIEGYSILFRDPATGLWGQVIDIVSVVQIRKAGTVTRVRKFIDGYRAGWFNECIKRKWRSDAFPYQTA